MAREITQRELRNYSGDIMRALDRKEAFVVTRNGVFVGDLVPLRACQHSSTTARRETRLRIDNVTIAACNRGPKQLAATGAGSSQVLV